MQFLRHGNTPPFGICRQQPFRIMENTLPGRIKKDQKKHKTQYSKGFQQVFAFGTIMEKPIKIFFYNAALYNTQPL